MDSKMLDYTENRNFYDTYLSNLDTELIHQTKYMYEKKKILVEKAFEQAKNELSKKGKSPRAAYINSLFEEKFGFAKNERSFVRYYTNLVEKNIDYYIDDITLDQLSKYVGYKDYDDFCKAGTYTSVNGGSSSTNVRVSIDEPEMSLTEKIIQIVINFTPVFKMPEFLTKQSGVGILGVLLIGGIFLSKNIISDDQKDLETINSKNRVGLLDAQKQCMYWNGKEYVPEYCSNTKIGLIAIDMKLVDNFKKITRVDTITIDNYENFWYSKYRNKVEFFTADGKNPENGKGLDEVSKGIFEKYILQRIDYSSN